MTTMPNGLRERLEAAVRALRQNDTITAEPILAHLLDELGPAQEAPADPEDRWRTGYPSAEEVRAHAEAHPFAAEPTLRPAGLWLVAVDDGPRPMTVLLSVDDGRVVPATGHAFLVFPTKEEAPASRWRRLTAKGDDLPVHDALEELPAVEPAAPFTIAIAEAANGHWWACVRLEGHADPVAHGLGRTQEEAGRRARFHVLAELAISAAKGDEPLPPAVEALFSRVIA